MCETFGSNQRRTLSQSRRSYINTRLAVKECRVFQISATAQSARCDFLVTAKIALLNCRDCYVEISVTVYNNLHWSRGVITLRIWGWSNSVTNPWIAEILPLKCKQCRNDCLRGGPPLRRLGPPLWRSGPPTSGIDSPKFNIRMDDPNWCGLGKGSDSHESV